ncbi:MAG: hypothetical protein ACJ8HJ_29315, partial [Massilia sp.]
RWKDYTQSFDEPRRWVAEAIRTDRGFASLAARMLSRGTSHTAGDRVSTSRSWFNRETIDDLIGIDVARARCDAIDAAEFPEYEGNLRALKSAVDEWTKPVEGEKVGDHAGEPQ